MGLKGNNISFLADLQILQCVVILFGLFNLSVCLFEDQIGKFDWKQNYIGQLKFAHFETVSTAKRIIVATEENVVAALHLKTGQIIWRQVLEAAQQGQVQLLHVDSEVVSVTGTSPWLVRGWDSNTGLLLWEWSLALVNPERAADVRMFVAGDQLVQVVPVAGPGARLEVTQYNLRTGQNKGTTTSVSAPWIADASRCTLAKDVFVCLSSDNSEDASLHFMQLSEPIGSVKTHTVHNLIGTVPGKVELSALPSTSSSLNGFVLLRNNVARVVLLEPSGLKVLPNSFASNVLLSTNYQEDIFVESKFSENNLIINVMDSNGKEVESLTTVAEFPASLGVPRLSAALCKGVACRMLVETSDKAMAVVQVPGGKISWTREESLAEVVAAEFLELPATDEEVAIEKEFGSKDGDFVGMLYRRLASQFGQLVSLVTGLPSGGQQNSALVRDKFSLHKLIVLVTRAGKVFGFDSVSGEILWSLRLNNLEPFDQLGKAVTLLVVQRTTRHHPLPALCTIIAKHADTGNGLLFTFNPLTGAAEGPAEHLPYKIKQVLVLPEMDSEYIHGIVLLAEDDSVHLYPPSAKKTLARNAAKTFMYTADPRTGAFTGYGFGYSTADKAVANVQWQLQLGPEKVVALATKSVAERVHSQGRVLSDRSVLYKYVNPNLLAVATLASDPTHRSVLSVYLIDSITGLIVYSTCHKRARGPVLMVHSENWLLYSYHNERWRRTEISSIELYEGATQSNSTYFSSHAVSQLPHSENEAFILPASPLAMLPTVTERGITNKHILMALSSGSVIEIPWAFMEPRRPLAPVGPEEGPVPYMPQLPLPSEAVINYNQSIARTRGLHVGPSGLESTCLVLVYGLDMFFTRVNPSKTFDLLKDDFDHGLIVIVLTALIAASYISKNLASRKALKQAWK